MLISHCTKQLTSVEVEYFKNLFRIVNPPSVLTSREIAIGLVGFLIKSRDIESNITWMTRMYNSTNGVIFFSISMRSDAEYCSTKRYSHQKRLCLRHLPPPMAAVASRRPACA